MANFGNHADRSSPAETPGIGKRRAVPCVIELEKSTIQLEEHCAVCNGYRQVVIGVICDACNGSGLVKTELGERVLEFVQRHIDPTMFRK